MGVDNVNTAASLQRTGNMRHRGRAHPRSIYLLVRQEMEFDETVMLVWQRRHRNVRFERVSRQVLRILFFRQLELYVNVQGFGMF